MESLTYQQVLADTYEEHATDIFVYQNEDDKDIPAIDNHPEELENQEDFKKFEPRLGSELLKPILYNDLSTTNILYHKCVKTNVLSIDSRFRFDEHQINIDSVKNNSNRTSTNFIYHLLYPVKNVVSMRMSSIEFPNTFYTFSKVRGNTSFFLTYPTGGTKKEIVIDDGNWDSTPLGVNSLIVHIKSKINVAFPINSITLTINEPNGKVTISSPNPFDLNFRDGVFSKRVKDYGLGYNLGFTEITGLYNGLKSYTAESILNVIDTNYVFINLHPDWKVVYYLNPDSEESWSFSKVIINQPKFSVCYNDGSNTLSKEYFFNQPTDISNFPVTVTDPYGQILDLNGMDFSFTLELKEITNSSVYESMRS